MKIRHATAEFVYTNEYQVGFTILGLKFVDIKWAIKEISILMLEIYET